MKRKIVIAILCAAVSMGTSGEEMSSLGVPDIQSQYMVARHLQRIMHL